MITVHCGTHVIHSLCFLLLGQFLGSEGDIDGSNMENQSRNIGPLHQNCQGEIFFAFHCSFSQWSLVPLFTVS